MSSYEDALRKLREIDQEQILQYWDDLGEEGKQSLLNQINTLDIDTFFIQKQILQKTNIHSSVAYTPFLDYATSGNASDFAQGWELITKGKVGCLLIAGGQGTRLGFAGPKGCYPITPLSKKSLFQFFAEKVAAASKKADRLLPLAIMTSPMNDQVTRDFFHSHQLFGLDATQLSFFVQDVLPLLDQEGDLFLEEQGKIAEGPNGNGYSLKHFVEQGGWEQWKKQGVEFINYVLVDNPLADPFDAELIGFHCRKQAEITIKCTEKRTPQEKVGVVVKQEHAVKIVEYSELPIAESEAYLKEGILKHRCANLSLFCFNMNWVKKASKRALPLHKALKKVNVLTNNDSSSLHAWKYETFIFDLLAEAHSVQALLYPREECFAPLKNSSGEDSVPEVQRALEKQAKAIYYKITGILPLETPFELPIEYYYL